MERDPKQLVVGGLGRVSLNMELPQGQKDKGYCYGVSRKGESGKSRENE